MDINDLPLQYRPLSPWAYFGYTLLFNIPVIGLIIMIIFSFNDVNINRRNFARSFFLVYILIIVSIVVLLLVTGYFFPIINKIREFFV